jgi:hypothetical protein
MTGIAQALIFLLIVWSRSSAQWGVFAVLLISFIAWWRSQARMELIRSFAFLPLLVVLMGMVGVRIYTHYAVHPAYFTDELLPHHLIWHSAYLGLTVPRPELMSDDFAFKASTHYMAETQPDFPFTQSPITNGYWFRLHDRTIRHLFLQFALEHPLYMIQLHTWWKPVRFAHIYMDAIGPALRTVPMLGLASILALLVISSTWLPPTWRTMPLSAVVPTAVIALSSLTPVMWAYPNSYVMVDSVWAMSVLIFVLLWGAVTLAFRPLHA